MQQRQAGRAATAAGRAPPQVDVIGQLKDLAARKDQGILADEGFAQRKERVLA